MLVIAQRLTVGSLTLFAEMSTARLPSMQGVETDELAQLQKIGDASSLLERLIELNVAARNVDVSPELRAQLGNPLERDLETGFVARHTAVFPHDLAELAVERRHRSLVVYGQEFLRSLRHFAFRRLEC